MTIAAQGAAWDPAGPAASTFDQVKVKVLGFDDRGKVKLSMRVVDQATGADIT